MAGLNPAQLEDIVSKLPDEQLAQSLRDPNSQIPAFMALSEIKRRQTMRNAAQAQQATGPTVREGVAGFAGGGWLGNMFDFEKFNLKKIGNSIKENPERAFLGGLDPVGRKLWGTILNKDYDHALNAYGGPSDETYAQAEAQGINTGPSEASHRVAQAIASIYAGGALGSLAGKAANAGQAAMAGTTAAEGAAGAAEAGQAAQAASAADAASTASTTSSGFGGAGTDASVGGLGGMESATPAAEATGSTASTSSGFGGTGTDQGVGGFGKTSVSPLKAKGASQLGMMGANYGGSGSGDRRPKKERKKYSTNPGEEYTEYEYDPDGQDYLEDTSEGQFYRPVTRRFAEGGLVDEDEEELLRAYLSGRGKLPKRSAGGLAGLGAPMGDNIGYGTTGGLLGLSTPMYEGEDEWVDKVKVKNPQAAAAKAAANDPMPVLTPQPPAQAGGASVRVSGPAFQAIPLPNVLTKEQALGMLPAAPKRQFTDVDASATRADELKARYGQNFSKAEEAQEKRRQRLEARRGDDKNMALLKAGLGIMGGTSSNAFENIAKGAMGGVDYYAQAQEAQRREEDAVAKGDMDLAAAMHQDKLQLLQLAMGESGKRDEAANADSNVEYQRGLSALGMVRESEKDRAAVQRDNAKLKNEMSLAQWRAANTAAGGGRDELKVDNAMAQKVFGQLVARDEQRIAELGAKEPKGQLTLNEKRELAALRSPNRMREITQQAYDAVGSPGGAYFKRSGREYDGGIGGMGVIDATTKR